MRARLAWQQAAERVRTAAPERSGRPAEGDSREQECSSSFFPFFVTQSDDEMPQGTAARLYYTVPHPVRQAERLVISKMQTHSGVAAMSAYNMEHGAAGHKVNGKDTFRHRNEAQQRSGVGVHPHDAVCLQHKDKLPVW